jgi:hypothetical protein
MVSEIDVGAAAALQRPPFLLRRWIAVCFSDPKGSFGKESFGRGKGSRYLRACRVRTHRFAIHSMSVALPGQTRLEANLYALILGTILG